MIAHHRARSISLPSFYEARKGSKNVAVPEISSNDLLDIGDREIPGKTLVSEASKHVSPRPNGPHFQKSLRLEVVHKDAQSDGSSIRPHRTRKVEHTNTE